MSDTEPSDPFFEDVEVGSSCVKEDARTITEADIVNFAGISGDFHAQHMSEPFAKEDSSFSGRVAHGNLVFVITEGLIGEHVYGNPNALAYGHDNLRFVEPVYVGDTLSVTRTVLDKENHDEDFGRVTYRFETTNQDGDTVLVDDKLMLLRKRTGSTEINL